MTALLRWHKGILGAALLAGSVVGGQSASAQVVPGTGTLVNTDDLEDANWGYTHNWPKSSKEEDEQIRQPLGFASNRKWNESPKRGSPDVIKRVDTPPNGLPGSTGALYLRTRDSGIPGRPGHKQAQDDFILAAKPMRVGAQPNYTVRVYLPEWDQWEQRNGVTFGIRAGMQGPMEKQKEVSFGRRLFKGSRMETVTEMEPYYPGFFIQFNPKSMPGNKEGDHALILIRADGLGHEVPGPKITATGWWTFGMSVSPDARCHYFASPGVDDLTARDHIYSSLPYGIPGQTFNTIFFNVCSADDGRTWSTPWIIDDPKVFAFTGSNMAQPKQVAQQPAPQQPAPLKTAANPAPIPQPAAVPQAAAPAAPQSPVAPTTPAVPAPVATPAAPAAPAVQATAPQAPAVQQPTVQQPAAAQARQPVANQPQMTRQPNQVPQQQQQRAATVPQQQQQQRPAQQAAAPQQRPAQPAATAARPQQPAPAQRTSQPQQAMPQRPTQPGQPIQPGQPVQAQQPAVQPRQQAAAPVPAPVQTPAQPAVAPAQPAAQAAMQPVAKPVAPAITVPPVQPAPVIQPAPPVAAAPVAPVQAAPVKPAPVAAPVAPALPAAPVTQAAPAPVTRIAQAPTPEPATTPMPKVISAGDFFAPPPRAPLAPVNPATLPPSPPPIQ